MYTLIMVSWQPWSYHARTLRKPAKAKDFRAVSLLPTGSEERDVMGVGSIPVAILPSFQDMKTIAL